MSIPPQATPLEQQIDQWRSYLLRRRAIHAVDIDELEDHLREQIAGLADAGLAVDEAFLVAVKRMGDLDMLSREFAREHAERLWKQLVTVSDATGETPASARTDTILALCLAVAAAVSIKVPLLFGVPFTDAGAAFYARNLSLFVLPFLTGYFVWKRRLDARTWIVFAMAFIAAAIIVNIWPFAAPDQTGALADTEALLVLHLPIALWLLVGIAYAGSRWKGVAGRMDFIRFTGEFVIYYVLIAFDLVLVVVLGLLLYSISARDPAAGTGIFDVLQVVLVASALVADAVALWAIVARISEFGFSPNRVAALGENVILLVNLLGSTVLYVRFLRGRGSFVSLERWQMEYLYVYAAWATLVVIVFPPVFGYI
jgi:hypothetical protein